MTWLKMTRRALYLMQGGGSKYLEKVDLDVHNLAKNEYKLDVPLHWFQGTDAPRRMAIETDENHPEPEPATGESVLDTYDRVITTQQWGARPRSIQPQTDPQYIVIHHTAHKANPNPPNDDSRRTQAGGEQLARTFQRVHIDINGWHDSGHNFLNTTGGFLLEGRHGSLAAVIRGNSVRSAHARSTPGKLAGGNLSPGIENEGNFSNFQMVPQQWNSLVDLCAAICKSCNIDPNNIRGHREFTATECPGQWLFSQLPRLRQEVRDRLARDR